ncbi:MAG: hypothetical protein H7174_10250, partial [Flavobacterium sp.]|nr:hypothetical protein [Flavobacterium sp.]
TPIIINVIVPPGATLGNVRMRIRGGNNTILTTGQACGASASAFGETEDYIVNIIGTTICVATAPPTSLSLSPNNTSISGSFALPSPIADGYLVVRSLSPVAPTPVTGTSYIIGGTVGPGYNVVDTDSNNLFSTTGLAAGTLYYFYVFSVKSICSGGPVYGTVLSGSISTTLTTQGCVDATSTSKTYFLNNFSTVGNLTNVNNVNTGYTNSGYTDYTSLQTTTQIQGGGINCKYNSNGIINLKVWVDWDRNGVFSDPAELVYTSNGTAAFSTSFGFVVPLTAIGNYRLRIRTYSLYAGPPGPSDTMATLTPCGNLSNGETEDYKLNIVADCAAKITNVVDGKRCDTGTVILEATCTTAATQFNWYDAETGGALIGTSLKTGLTNDTIWTTPSIAATTEYWVQAYSPTCASFYREKVIAKVNITTIITFTPLAPTVCGENTIISVAAAGDFEVFDLINEDFEGTPQFTTNNVSSIGFEWTTKPSVFVPTGTVVWRPAISSRNAGNNFAYTTSDTAAGVIDTKLTSNSLNTVGFQDLTLTFRHYLSFYNATLENCLVQASINGGTSWTNIFNFRSNCGEATSLKTESITLPGYLNQSNLQIRFWYNTNFGDGWCIDDIRLYGKKTVNTTFTWGGGADAYADALATIPYNPLTMSLSTVYIKPTAAQLANPTWTFTANATIANGCVVSKPVTITNNNKKWLGSTSNWNTASNWEPSGVPTSSNCVVIPNTSIVSGSGYTGYGKNLIVKSTGNLNIQTGNNLVIEDLITVDTGGVLNIENNSSLVQINNVTNLGNINYTRIAPLIRGYDYVYWSSPVSGQNISSIYTSPTQGPKCFWDTVGINANGGLGNWGAATSSMNTAQGYIIRGSSSNSTPATNIIANFNGVPNNGNITIKAKRGNMTIATVPSFYSNAALSITDDNWSLLGNPYPSAINGLQFLSTNSSNLVGTLAMWRHINNLAATASPFYQNFALNYNSNDYLSINFTGTTVPTASDLIQAGQAFMIQRKEGTQDLTGVDVVFNNSMRLNAGVPYANNAFYRSSIQDNNLALTPTERHRVWLDIIDVNSQKSSTALLGYVQGATQDEDNLFDGPITLYPSAQIFTMIDNKKFVIQGRALPFSTSDIVPIGIKTQTNGNYMIAINAVDGLFNNQNIYLEDKLLNITHDLKSAPYSFTSPSGIYADRFDLKYETTSLSNIDFESISTNDLKIINDNKLSLYSTKLNIKKTEIFDLLGRKVDEYKNVDSKNLLLDNLIKSAKIYIIKTTFNDDSVLSKKVIF